jgi:hypothetical protein
VRSYPCPSLHLFSAFCAAAAAVLLAGCSSTRQAPTTAQAAAPAGPPGVGISPGGVTTSVDTPASSTEKEYYDACHWARVWMSERPGDPDAEIEPYLAMVQASPTGGPGTWNTPWAQLAPERQSALIVAVRAAADGRCD